MSRDSAPHKSENRFQSLLEKSFDAVTVVDSQGIATYASPSTTRILGYSPEEFVGRSIFDTIHPDDLPRIHRLFGELLNQPGATVSAEFRWRHKDGAWRWIEAAGTNLLADADVQGIVGNYHDITERKNLEEELRQRMEDLARADRCKDDFLAVLAHELRNPLASVRNGLAIVKQLEKRDTIIGQTHDMMERQVQQLARLVDDLLDVARITHGKIELHLQTTCLAPIVQAAVQASRSLIDSHQQKLCVSLPDEPLHVHVDPGRLEQILSNLLNNATKYTGDGGHIRLSAAKEGSDLVIKIQDTGVGIAKEMLSRIFEPFRQIHRAENDSQGGLGIGLSLVRQFVEMHRGTVSAFSRGPGRGSEFVVRMPVVVERQAPSTLREDRAVLVPPKCRILVVDDNEDAAKSLGTLLRLEGHDVRIAYSGPKALEIAQENAFDIALLDIGMPGMDGYQLARKIRTQPASEKMTLIAMTGYGQDDDRRRSHEAGFQFHLVKPVEPESLKKVLGS